MKRSASLVVFTAAIVAAACLQPAAAWAVPAFARQKNKPCTDCHTMWPRLNSAGREFKELGYADMDPDTPRIEKDNLDLLKYGPPIAVSIINFPYQKSSGQKPDSSIPDEVALFFAGRIAPNLGAFVSPKWSRETHSVDLELLKIATGMKLASHDTVGLALVKGDATAADPYNTLRYTAFVPISTPAILLPNGRPSGGDLFNLSDSENEGLVANGLFFGTIYAAVGGFRGDGAAASVETDPLDVYARVALERAFTGELGGSIGGLYYGGKQLYDHTGDLVSGPAYESTFHRYAADLQIQYDSVPHLAEAMFTYLQGKDNNVWDGVGGQSDVSFEGYYGELSYFYDRKYGITIAYDHLTSSEDPSLDKKGPTANLMYLPWLNTKLAVEFSNFEFNDGTKEHDVTMMVQVYF